MMKKRVLTLCMATVLAFSVLGLTSCGENKETVSGTVVLRIANCEEYIDEGDWDDDELIELDNGAEIIGENALVDDFEDWYYENYGQKVKVEYSTYGTNEELYNQMSLGTTFDLVCPSEYMIMKLMDEGRLTALSDSFFDDSVENNYYIKGVSPYIKNMFEEIEINDEPISKYSAGYMWGNMGIVYNPELVDEEDVTHWKMLLDSKYEKRITMKDGVRDSLFIAQCILNEKLLLTPAFLNDTDYQKNLENLVNDTSQPVVDQVEEILSQMRENSYSMETDSGKADMVTGKVVANMQWSGDAVYSLDQAEEDGVELAYAVPEEGSNKWFDGWVMMKNGIEEDARKQDAAEAFMNFISRPDNVVRNMYYIGYTSTIAGGDDDTVLSYARYCYEAEDDEEEIVSYDLGYFFGDDLGDAVIEASESQLKRQLYAQYPPQETIERCAIMKFFTDEANGRIAQMWTNIRCFDLKKIVSTKN